MVRWAVAETEIEPCVELALAAAVVVETAGAVVDVAVAAAVGVGAETPEWEGPTQVA